MCDQPGGNDDGGWGARGAEERRERDADGAEPPRPWRWLLAGAAPPRQRDALLGDVAEEYGLRRRRDGPRAARRWYRRQAVAMAVHGFAHRAGRTEARSHGRGGDGMMASWLHDLRHAVRVLLRRPVFTVGVVATLSLAVGATTALFGVFRAVFLEPLSVPDPDEIVILMEEGSFGCCGPASGPDYADWAERQRSFTHLAALSPTTVTLGGLDEPRRVYGVRTTANAFDMLRVPPLLGRTLHPDDELPDTARVVVLAHAFWERELGADPGILGRTLELNGTRAEVVGVMPPGFDIPSPWLGTQSHRLYLPFPRSWQSGSRGSHSYPVIGRLADGVDLEAARQDMERVVAGVNRENPDTHDRIGRVFDAHEYMYGNVGSQLLLILAAAGLVLLVACGNVAGLQLARAAEREPELALRAALGASRRRLVRLLLSEALLLAAAGGALGVLVAVLALDGFQGLLPPTVPRTEAIGIDGAALLFAFGAAAATALVFGVLPALLASRTDLATSVKEGGYSTLAPGKERLRDAFIVGQIALGLVLVNGAALLLRSYLQLRDQDQGFEASGVMTASVSPTGARYPDQVARGRFYEDVVERIDASPGVQAAGMVSKLPLHGGSNGNVWVEGRPAPAPGEGVLVEVSSVVGDYFDAMGMELLAGRPLEAGDSATGAQGAVINRVFAEQGWPGESAVGKRFSFGTNPPNWAEVVGVVEAVRQWRPEDPPLAEAYMPFTRGWSGSGYLVVRTDGDPTRVLPDIRGAIGDVDPTLPLADVRTMTERVETRYAQRRFYTTLVTLFAAAALLLAAGGIYGTVSYFVARRTRELGIRMALGSGRSGVMGVVVRRGLRLAVWGVVLGVAGAWATTSVLESLVWGVAALDAPTLALGAGALAAVTVAATVLPALRAIRVSPVSALRME